MIYLALLPADLCELIDRLLAFDWRFSGSLKQVELRRLGNDSHRVTLSSGEAVLVLSQTTNYVFATHVRVCLPL